MEIARHHLPVGRLRRENMRIAICDDDDRSRSFYSNLIQNIAAKRGIHLQIEIVEKIEVNPGDVLTCVPPDANSSFSMVNEV